MKERGKYTGITLTVLLFLDGRGDIS